MGSAYWGNGAELLKHNQVLLQQLNALGEAGANMLLLAPKERDCCRHRVEGYVWIIGGSVALPRPICSTALPCPASGRPSLRGRRSEGFKINSERSILLTFRILRLWQLLILRTFNRQGDAHAAADTERSNAPLEMLVLHQVKQRD